MTARDWADRVASSRTAKLPRMQGNQGSEQQVRVGIGDAAAEEHRSERPQQHEGPERDRALAPGLADSQQDDADQAAIQEPKEGADAELGPAEVAKRQAQDSGQLDVPEAHTRWIGEDEREVE